MWYIRKLYENWYDSFSVTVTETFWAILVFLVPGKQNFSTLGHSILHSNVLIKYATLCYLAAPFIPTTPQYFISWFIKLQADQNTSEGKSLNLPRNFGALPITKIVGEENKNRKKSLTGMNATAHSLKAPTLNN